MSKNELVIPTPEQQNRILSTEYEDALEIISHEDCEKGIEYLLSTFANKHNYPIDGEVLLIPILRGGSVIGERLSSTGVWTQSMRISYYDEENKRMEQPRCIKALTNIYPIVLGKIHHIVFAEAVVESQNTILAAKQQIWQQVEELGGNLDSVDFSTFALVSKIPQDTQITISNLTAAFKVHPSIWVHGYGCDNKERGREVESIMGVLSPYAEEQPYGPWVTPLFQQNS